MPASARPPFNQGAIEDLVCSEGAGPCGRHSALSGRCRWPSGPGLLYLGKLDRLPGPDLVHLGNLDLPLNPAAMNQ
jgi:hypothetical protein